jgi:hypothetical protein
VETKKGTLSKKAEVVLIEIKYGQVWKPSFEKSMRSFAENKKVVVKKMFGVYNGKESLERNGILVLPTANFLQMLQDGQIY